MLHYFHVALFSVAQFHIELFDVALFQCCIM